MLISTAACNEVEFFAEGLKCFRGPLESKMNQKQPETVLITLEHNPLDSCSIRTVAGGRVI